MTAAVGDSIRSEMVNQKENTGQATGEKKTVGQPINGSADEP
jgi:hypothetical protein